MSLLRLQANDNCLPSRSQHNKFCCFFSTAVLLITPVTQNAHCFRSAIFNLAPAQVGMHLLSVPSLHIQQHAATSSEIMKFVDDASLYLLTFLV
jgi:hypothetical protein